MLNPYVIVLLYTQFEHGLTLFTLSSSPSTLLVIVRCSDSVASILDDFNSNYP